MGNNYGLTYLELTLTPRPSPETVIGAAVQFIQSTETYGGKGGNPGIYPDPVAGWDIGYGTQINSTNLPYILSQMGVTPANASTVGKAVLQAVGAGGNPEAGRLKFLSARWWAALDRTGRLKFLSAARSSQRTGHCPKAVKYLTTPLRSICPTVPGCSRSRCPTVRHWYCPMCTNVLREMQGL